MMGQAEVAEVLENNPGVLMSAEEISKELKGCGLQSVHHSLRSLIKRDDFESVIVSGPGRYGSKTLYRYVGELN